MAIRSQAVNRSDLHRIPAIPLPLAAEELPEPLIDLQTLLHEIYDRGSYDLAIDYHSPLSPQLLAEDADWVTNHMQQQGLLKAQS